MAVDLDERPADAGSDELNPGQRHYDDVFDELTSKEHMAKDGTSGNTGGGLYNDGGDSGGKASSKTGAAAGTSSGARGLYNSAKDTRQRFGKRLGGLMKKKWVVGAAVGGGGLGILLLLLLLLTASFKIPHLAENITAYQFARATQQMSRNSTRILSEKIAVDSVSKGVYDKLAKKYGAVGKVQETWSKLDKFRPNKIIKNMSATGEAQFEYGESSNGRQILRGIRLSDTSFPVNQPSLRNLIPGVKFANNVRFATAIAPRLNTSIKANAWGPIVRGRVAKQIRTDLGISLIAWKVGEYKGKSAEQARLLAERESFKKIAGSSEGSVKTEPLKSASSDAKEAAQRAVADDKQLTEAVKNGGKIKAVTDSIAESFKESPFSTAAKFINASYAIATPVCIVYEGSVEHSGPTVDQQMGAQQKAYYLVASAADQQKDGADGSAEATGAFNDKLGDINGSLPMLRASGETADTSSYTSAEAGAGGGTFSIADALFGKNKATKAIDYLGDNICPFLTDPVVVGAITGINVAILIIPGLGQGTAAAEQAAQKGATTILGRIAERVTATIIGKRGAVNVSGKLGDVITSGVKSGVKIAATTVLAKMIVASKSGYTNNGLEQGADFANIADSGGNIAGNEISRKEFYGRPLTKDEAATAAAESIAFVNKQNATKSSYQRYIALSNPQSLLSKFATHTASSLPGLDPSKFLKRLGNILDPSALFSGLFSAINPQAVHAATLQNASALNYGNVQFGFSSKEQALMDEDETYGLLENQRILDKSGKEDEIEETYGECFSSSLGDLIQEGKIIVDDDRNVVDSKDKEAICSPRNLTYTNSEYGKQMVFRWRVAHSYDGTLNQFEDMQEETVNATGGDVPVGKLCNISGGTEESSGLALSKTNPDLVYTEGDHGWSGPLIYAIQISTCKVVGTTNTNMDSKIDDPEAISIDPSGRLWVADLGDGHPHQAKFGDKDKNEPPSRKDMAIYIFNEPGTGDHKGVAAQRYPIVYSPAGEYHGSYNVEALLISPSGQAYLISKDGAPGSTSGCLFKLPKTLVAGQNNVARSMGCNMPDFVSDATFSKDGKWVFIRTKEQADTLVYNANTWTKVGSLPNGVSNSELPTDHVEGITMDADGRSFLLSSETKHTNLKGTPLVRVALPQAYLPPGTVPIGSGGSGGPNGVDLSIWKLTLPDASEIDRGKLQTYNNCPTFCRQNGGILFTAIYNGGHTGGSKYTRSELRELTAGDEEGDGWSNSSGTHEMIISEAIMSQPKGNGGRVVAGQIHDDEDDVVKILLDGSTLYASFGLGKGNGDKDLLLASNYKLGTRFTVKITASGGRTTITYNNTTTQRYNRAYKGAYFKAGVYPQSNSSGDGGSVMIYGLSVKHS